jgi:type IV pilus assembly protein PilV
MKAPAPVSFGPGRGLALLEVLLSSFILATGLLAVLNMQTLAVGTAQTNGHLLQAEWLLHDMLERIKANPSGFGVALAAWPDGQSDARCESPTGCTTTELAAHDLAGWQRRLAERLPGGYGEIEPVTMAEFPLPAATYRVSVRWLGSGNNDGDAQLPASSGIVVL